MTRNVTFRGITGQTYYAKPLPLMLPWSNDHIIGIENGTLGSFEFSSLQDATAYEIFQQSGVNPVDSDKAVAAIDVAQVDLVDVPNATAVTAIQDGLSTFDASADEVTTNAASRSASQADVSTLATAAALAIIAGDVNQILTDTSTTIPNLLPANFELLLINSSGHIEHVTLVDTTTDLTNDGGGGLDAAGLRSAIGMASANLDTQLGGIANDTGTDLPNAISSLSVQVSVVDSNVDTIVTSTGVTIPSQINNLNDLSAADIDARLTAYDAPTKNEIDVAQASIEAACATLTTSQLRAAISGRWTDEDGNTFDLVVTDTP